MNIYDIAKSANVSIATVSRVINNSDKVSEKTRERVLKIMKENNYTPNVFARGLGLDTMRMIGLVCTDAADIQYAKALSLLEKELRAHKYDTLLCCSGTDTADKKKALDLLIKKRVDAIILIGSAFAGREDVAYITEAAKSLPVFILNGYVEGDNVYCVLCDDKKAVSDSVHLLYDKGSRDILYIYDIETYSGSQKKSGYTEAVASLGITPHVVKTDKTVNGAYQSVLDYVKDNKIDGIIASEDILAIGAQKACPVSTVGFNNSVLAECANPSLTSVDGMLDEICPMIVQSIVDLDTGASVPKTQKFGAKIIFRQSLKK